jgi:hypothetical protein
MSSVVLHALDGAVGVDFGLEHGVEARGVEVAAAFRHAAVAAALGHQPCGELNENRRGSSSSKDRLQDGQLALVERRMNFLSAVRSLMRPLPISRAARARCRLLSDCFAL